RWSMRRWAGAWAVSCTPCNLSPRFPTEAYAYRSFHTVMSETNARIAQVVQSNDVVLFMKGTPLFPQCGFSSRAVAILDHCGVASACSAGLWRMGYRQGVREFSGWPTTPQRWLKGEFVGGSASMMEMYQAGRLQQLLDAQRVANASS